MSAEARGPDDRGNPSAAAPGRRDAWWAHDRPRSGRRVVAGQTRCVASRIEATLRQRFCSQPDVLGAWTEQRVIDFQRWGNRLSKTPPVWKSQRGFKEVMPAVTLV